MIENLSAKDRELWEPLWQQYLEFYETSLPAEQTALTFRRLMDPVEPITGFGAFHDDVLIGFAHVMTHRSTWAPTGYVYLEDLFVDPSVRGKGYGRALIDALYGFADDRGFDRVYWVTKSDNPARALYDQVAKESGFVQYRRTAPRG